MGRSVLVNGSRNLSPSCKYRANPHARIAGNNRRQLQQGDFGGEALQNGRRVEQQGLCFWVLLSWHARCTSQRNLCLREAQTWKVTLVRCPEPHTSVMSERDSYLAVSLHCSSISSCLDLLGLLLQSHGFSSTGSCSSSVSLTLHGFHLGPRSSCLASCRADFCLNNACLLPCLQFVQVGDAHPITSKRCVGSRMQPCELCELCQAASAFPSCTDATKQKGPSRHPLSHF